MHDEPGASVRSDFAGGGPSASLEEQEPLISVRLARRHKVAEFLCVRSERVQSFLREKAASYEEMNYARVFVIESRTEPGKVLGYYTLTAALLEKEHISTQLQKRVVPGLPVPLIRIGYMGRDDSAPQTLGAGLVTDAARRVYRNQDIAAWGLLVDAEGPHPKLMAWYESVKFKPVKLSATGKAKFGTMYAPFKSLIPELNA